jgi:hypothetical protein
MKTASASESCLGWALAREDIESASRSVFIIGPSAI